MRSDTNVKNLKQQTPRICLECGSNRKVEFCIACYAPVCPSHRAGFGSVSDGYTCMGCVGHGFGGFASAAVTPLPGRWLKREYGGWPLWLVVLTGVIIFLFMLLIAIGPPPR